MRHQNEGTQVILRRVDLDELAQEADMKERNDTANTNAQKKYDFGGKSTGSKETKAYRFKRERTEADKHSESIDLSVWRRSGEHHGQWLSPRDAKTQATLPQRQHQAMGEEEKEEEKQE